MKWKEKKKKLFSAHRKWVENRMTDITANLYGANLQGADLREVNLEGTGVTPTDLIKAGAKATPAIEVN